jgi:hypothetical protein
MAQDDDKYKEGVDFEWVQGNNDENSGFKTRRFFTKAEKKARSEPKVEAPKAKKKKPLKGITTEKITTTKLPPPAGPKPDLATLKRQASDQADISRVKRDIGETFAGKKFPAGSYKTGGMVKEGSAKDMREDKMKAKKAGMSMKTWEKSAADKKHDAPKKMAGGGVVKKASGGSMRGTGAAVRGKGFSGCY